MFHCPVGVWVIEQRAIILSATVRSPTVNIETTEFTLLVLWRESTSSTRKGSIMRKTLSCDDIIVPASVKLQLGGPLGYK